MRPALLLLITLFALVGRAADDSATTPAAKKPARQAKGQSPLPDSVAGVSDEEYARIRVALMATYGEESLVAARKRLTELKERTRFTNGRQEAEDLKADFDKARDVLVAATLDAVQRKDPTITKDAVVLTLNAAEELTRKRNQEVIQKQREKEAAQAKAAKKDAPEAKPEAAGAKETEAKAQAPVAILADVEGVSAEDMKKFRAAALAARSDPAVKELKAKQGELRKQAEYASADERKGMRGEFEAIQADVHKATLAAILKSAPTLSKETAEKILETVEARMVAANQKNMQKAATKTPLKPFPFAEKK